MKTIVNIMQETGINQEKATNLYLYGICWCENGKDSCGEKTTYCANCIYFSDCEAIDDLSQN